MKKNRVRKSRDTAPLIELQGPKNEGLRVSEFVYTSPTWDTDSDVAARYEQNIQITTIKKKIVNSEPNMYKKDSLVDPPLRSCWQSGAYLFCRH